MAEWLKRLDKRKVRLLNENVIGDFVHFEHAHDAVKNFKDELITAIKQKKSSSWSISEEHITVEECIQIINSI